MDKLKELIDIAKYMAECDALGEGEMRTKIQSIPLYETLQFGWIDTNVGTIEEFNKYADDAIEAYVKAYAEYYGATYEMDKWGNYDIK